MPPNRDFDLIHGKFDLTSLTSITISQEFHWWNFFALEHRRCTSGVVKFSNTEPYSRNNIWVNNLHKTIFELTVKSVTTITIVLLAMKLKVKALLALFIVIALPVIYFIKSLVHCAFSSTGKVIVKTKQILLKNMTSWLTWYKNLWISTRVLEVLFCPVFSSVIWLHNVESLGFADIAFRDRDVCRSLQKSSK